MNDAQKSKIAIVAIQLHLKNHKIADIIQFVQERILSIKEHSVLPSPEDLIRCNIDIYTSLMKAVDKAGGTNWSVDDLCNMTAMDLLVHLSTNNVKFVYKREDK